MRINLPNQITIARLFIAVIFFFCLTEYSVRAEHPKTWVLDVSTVLFLIAAISDIVDGYLARKQNQVTSFGRIIDPFVDKILVIGAYTFLAGDGFLTATGSRVSDVSAWMVVLIFGRELLVTSLRGVSEGSGESFGANVYGKAKMALQSTTIVWVLVTLAHPQRLALLVPLRPVLVYLTVIVTVLSVIPYLRAAKRFLAQTSVPTS
jgi:CDP-diacylglycerol---glycerol-3-phosphate 3-phosphatidyltransferase